ncbi:MAG: chain-length determining protein [Gammaproteobacteria bacterium]|nr:MAG: chain-length determining protein [Gammaproteobacteria bacterium]
MENPEAQRHREQNRELRSDEIDLFELFQNLWQQKLLIISITLAVTMLAAAFAFLSTPQYETKAGVLPPRMSDIAGYNLGRKEAGLDQFSAPYIYSLFKNNLLSVSLKRTFFQDHYLQVLDEDKRAGAQDKLWEEFNKILTVKAPDKNRPELYEVTVDYESPVLVAEWVNLYIEMAAKKAEKEMHENAFSGVAARVVVIKAQIDGLRTTARKQREDRIVRLRDALVVAEAVGLDAPQVVAGNTPSDGDLAQFIDGNLTYMRGAKAIRAELGVLEKRKNDDPFISELRNLENQLIFLKEIDVNPDDVSVFTLDSSAEVPETPVKPKKSIIIAVGLIVGGMLGVFATLICSMVKKRKIQAG